MPKLVSTDDLKEAITETVRRGDVRWLKRIEAEEMISDASDDEIGPLTMEELEEVLEEMSEE
jgi:hypothetical protein